MSFPKVSIITPSFNQGDFIERTILSVKDQDYPHIEHIVMDGGSTDNTLEILKKYEDGLIWRSEQDRGQAHAINKGLKMATGEILAYLNSDDTYEENAVATAVQKLIQHPEVVLVYGDCDIVDKQDKKIGIFEGIPTTFGGMLRVSRACIPQQTVFFRRCVLEDTGYFDENLHYALDTDFYIRVLKRHRTLYIPVNYANHRWHKQSKSVSESGKFRVDRIVILKKHGTRYLVYWYMRYRLISRIKRLFFGSKPLFRPKKGFIKISDHSHFR